MNYIVHDKDGRILRTGSCPESMLEQQAHGAGETAIEGIGGDETHRVVTDEYGTTIDEIPDSERPKPPAPTYATLRAKEYPSIGDQLDAILKGGAALEEMRARIEAVKNEYPKEG